MTQRWTTHGLDLRSDSVRKRFRPDANGEPEREWRALTLLDRYAPGLAPRPLSFTGGAVTMSRLPGTPLRGAELTGPHLDALARAVRRLHDAVPAGAAARLPARRWDVGESAAAIRTRAGAVRGPGARRALAAGLRWLDGAEAGLRAGGSSSVPVLGQADGNLANFLWDGADVRLVDFEDSGRSDRPYELAEMVEHVSAWVDTDLDAGAFLARFEPSPAEARRLPECRRLFALLWLVFLSGDASTTARNPPGTGERQALRLLDLLG
ncbi:phosphotransferase [Kitasatospora phosalacinea]|uniref:phosphotransferase n=1 Tax=Kitasatospora phosalacinea TaxID=2065 RepID=UPI0005265134|nr:phosphotransferase [Kitasatospora phosalacinea]